MGAMALSGCKGPIDLTELPVYDEAFQRTFFEAQNHLAKGDLAAAYPLFSSCLEREPEEQAVSFILGKIDFDLGRFDAAIFHFDNVLAQKTSDRWALEYRAMTLLELGRFDDATTDVLALVEQRRGDLDWVLDWTLRLADSGAIVGAIAVCEAFESGGMDDPDLLMQRLYFMELIGEYEAIYHLLEEAAQRHPDQDDLQYQWAQILQAAGQDEQALEVLLRLVQNNPLYGLAQLALARIWTQLEMIEEAQEALILAFESTDVSVDEKHDILVQYLKLGTFNTAFLGPLEPLMKTALRMHADDGNIQMLAADFEQTQGRTESARDHMILAVQFLPAYAPAWSNLIALDAELDDMNSMLSHAQAASERFPLSPEFHLMAGLAAEALSQTEVVRSSANSGLQMVINDPGMEVQLLRLLGDAERMVGNHIAAAEAFERILIIEPDNVLVLNNHSYYLALDQRQLERALECSSRVVKLVPGDANFWDTHAWVLHQMGRDDEALEAIQRALLLSDMPERTFFDHEGDIHRALGNNKEAIQAWENALKHGGDLESLTRKIHDAS